MLNRHLPLWYQVAQSLRAEILGSSSKVPYRLPTEAELAGIYGVSLITLRQALQTLESEGLIRRKRRLGTFALPDANHEPALKLVGLAEAVMAQHAVGDTRTLSRNAVPVPAALAAVFTMPKVYEFRRLRVDEGQPVAYVVNYLLPEYGSRIRSTAPFGSMTRLLKERFGVRIKRFQNTIEATLPSPEVARVLGIDVMTPILLITGVTTDHTDRVVDYLRLHYRADRYRFSIDVDVPV